MKIVTLTEQQFQEYSTKHKYRSYFQSIAYGKAMTQLGYDAQLLGFVSNNNNLVGASLIIYKKVFMNNKIAYAPRGILYDYDKTIIKTRIYAFKNGSIYSTYNKK